MTETNETTTRPAFFRELDVALISAGWDPNGVDELHWTSQEPHYLRLRMKPNPTTIYVTITTHSITIDHRSYMGHVTHSPNPDSSEPLKSLNRRSSA